MADGLVQGPEPPGGDGQGAVPAGLGCGLGWKRRGGGAGRGGRRHRGGCERSLVVLRGTYRTQAEAASPRRGPWAGDLTTHWQPGHNAEA